MRAWRRDDGRRSKGRELRRLAPRQWWQHPSKGLLRGLVPTVAASVVRATTTGAAGSWTAVGDGGEGEVLLVVKR